VLTNDVFSVSPKRARKLWVEALLSGKYEQGKNFLHTIEDNKYCCLGVACEVYREHGGCLSYEEGKYFIPDDEEDENVLMMYSLFHTTNVTIAIYGRTTKVLPDIVKKWLGVATVNVVLRDSYTRNSSNTPKSLASMNDAGVLFNEIARLIQNEEIALLFS
jgi:hypothetical protein